MSKDERLEFEQYGYSDAEIDEINEKLKAERWLFWAKASELFITLAGGVKTVYRNGKPQEQEYERSLKFDSNYATVNDRTYARDVFLSNAYRQGRIKLAEDHRAEEKEKEYAAFKDKMLRDPEMVKRIKSELAVQ